MHDDDDLGHAGRKNDAGGPVADGEHVVGVRERGPDLFVGSPGPEKFALGQHLHFNKMVERGGVAGSCGGRGGGRFRFSAGVGCEQYAREQQGSSSFHERRRLNKLDLANVGVRRLFTGL